MSNVCFSNLEISPFINYKMSLLSKTFHILSSSLEPLANQTWHKASLWKGIQDCSKEGPSPFPSGDNRKIAKIH